MVLPLIASSLTFAATGPRRRHKRHLPAHGDECLLGDPAQVRQWEARRLEAETERARNLPECRPAELDPLKDTGGLSPLGLQISAGCDQRLHGWPANRPHRDTPQHHDEPHRRSWHGPVHVRLHCAQSAQSAAHPKSRPLGLLLRAAAAVLPSRRQVKQGVSLDRIFNLTAPGKYTVYAKRPEGNWKALPETLSGPVPSEIISAPGRCD